MGNDLLVQLVLALSSLGLSSDWKTPFGSEHSLHFSEVGRPNSDEILGLEENNNFR